MLRNRSYFFIYEYICVDIVLAFDYIVAGLFHPTFDYFFVQVIDLKVVNYCRTACSLQDFARPRGHFPSIKNHELFY